MKGLLFTLPLLFYFGTSVNNSFQNKEQTYTKEEIKVGDILYFGIPDEEICFDGGFRVLDNKKTNTKEEGMFLCSENLIGSSKKTGMYFLNEKNPTDNLYIDSDAQKWCRTFVATHFNEAEQELMIATYKDDDKYDKDACFGGKNKITEVNFDPLENALSGDKLFIMSAEEADNPDYGFVTDENRLASFDGIATAYWLRSPHIDTFPIDVGLVFFNGWLMDYFENQDSVFGLSPICMRPAFNLDTSNDLNFIKISDNEWKLDISTASYNYGVRKDIKNRDTTFFTILIVVVALLILSFIASLVVVPIVLVKRHKKKKRLLEND